MSGAGSAWQTLVEGAESHAPYLQPSGELHDPVFGLPTQYGTAYFAYVNAVISTAAPGGDGAHLDRAVRGVDAALRHTEDPALPATASGFDRETCSVRGAGNHRDFTWPPILKTFRLLRASAAPDVVERLARRIAAVDIERCFRSRPPSNWASVWLSGEWIRLREGLSPFGRDDIDDWLAVFFDRLIDLELGLYKEPGLPNSYDLFTRFHLADMLAEGYDGRECERMERLMRTGLERSLAVQLSDGSLASAHRSTGQTWTVGAQVGYFTRAARFFTGRDDELAARAMAAARRAMASFALWQRPGGPFSPVQNLLPAARRVGYEGYTADAHYASLALAFLAGGLLGGYTDGPAQAAGESVRVEQAPTFRAVARRGRVSVQVNGAPAPDYDAFGITDLTFGPGRILHFGPSVRHLQTGAFVNIGIALRERSGAAPLDIVARRRHVLDGEITSGRAELRLASRVDESPGYRYTLTVRLIDDGVEIEETTPGERGEKTLLVPYLRDHGGGESTRVLAAPSGVSLTRGGERIRISVDAPIERVVDIAGEFENRRGLCGLIRLDLADPRESARYRIVSD